MLNWVDGVAQDSLALNNRGLAYGDGLFETIAVRARQPQLLARHLERLQLGCKRLALVADMLLVKDEIQRYAAQMGEGVLKLILTRGDSPRGYAAAPLASPYRILQAGPLPTYPLSHGAQGVQLFPCRTRLAEQPLLAGLKHLNRLEQVLARNEWSGGEFAEGLMCDSAGRVIEGVYSNLFLVRDGRLRTAGLQRCGVAGTLRAELLAQAPALSIASEVCDLSLADLAAADEVFVCNSVYGIWPVLACAEMNWPAGPLTRKLQTLASALLDL
jgi:4-amino-4-deoxychorismate lyase